MQCPRDGVKPGMIKSLSAFHYCVDRGGSLAVVVLEAWMNIEVLPDKGPPAVRLRGTALMARDFKVDALRPQRGTSRIQR